MLDSKQFYQALLSPIDLVTLDAFVRQGYSHELLYLLFIDSIRRTIAGRTVEYRNDPRAPCEMAGGQRRCFKDVIDAGVASGLTVETLATGQLGRSPPRPITRACAWIQFSPSGFGANILTSGQHSWAGSVNPVAKSGRPR